MSRKREEKKRSASKRASLLVQKQKGGATQMLKMTKVKIKKGKRKEKKGDERNNFRKDFGKVLLTFTQENSLVSFLFSFYASSIRYFSSPWHRS